MPTARPDRLLVAASLLLVLASATAPSPPASPMTSSLHRVSWLSGCWEARIQQLVVEERWTPPHGGIMMGVSRTVNGDSLVDYSFLLLFERDGRLVYEARRSGEGLRFPSVALTDTSMAFEDSTRDFPRKIFYVRSGRDAIVGRVAGKVGERFRALDYRFHRVSCEARR